MKLWQIAGAVLIFKLFDITLQVAAGIVPAGPPIVVFLIAFAIWLLLSAIAWQVMREIDEKIFSRFERRNG